MTSPTQRSLALLKSRGFVAGVVERFNPHVGPHGIRQDFCGGIDLIAFRAPLGKSTMVPRIVPLLESDGYGGVRIRHEHVEIKGLLHAKVSGQILGVQCCGQTGHAAHKAKLLAEPRMREWVAAGGRLVIHSWRKLAVVKKDGKKGKTKRYECREEEITMEMFESAPSTEPTPVSEMGNEPVGGAASA